MNLYRILASALLMLAAAIPPAAAQTFPSKQVRIIGLTAGGTTDLVSRILTQKLAESWGQNVIVDNRPGASGQTRAVNRGPLAGCERP